MDLKSDCTAWECEGEFEDAMWAARAIDTEHEDRGDIRYLVGRFEQAASSIARRTAHPRSEVMDQIRYLATRSEVAS